MQSINCTEVAMLSFLFLVTTLIISGSEAARILAIFPAPSISHQIVFRPLTEELAKRGHEVVVITTDPAFPKGKTPPNLTEIDVHDISYNAWKTNKEVVSKGGTHTIAQMQIVLSLITLLLKQYFENEEINNVIKTTKFDLLLVESIARPALIYGHICKVPVIQVSSFGAIFDNYDTVGAPTHTFLYPISIRRRINNLSTWEKILQLYEEYSLVKVLEQHDEENNALLKKYIGADTPTVNEMLNNVDMLFLNIHPIFEGIRPVPPSVLYMGGLHQKPQKELPADLKSYLDSSKNGVIYLSFGTNVVPSMLPPESFQIIVRVLSELPYNVLWKYDKDVLPGKNDNIKIGKWFPQSDLLRHPNVKLFITQGGLQSTDEAITAGVPLIAFPVLGDQWFNAEKYEHHKIGIKLDIETITYDEFKTAVNNVIGDESYRRNIVHLRELMRDEPMKPLERAVWWTEHVLRHGGAKHLRAPAANITWAQYLELELVLIVLVGVFAFLLFSITILYYLWKILKILIASGKEKKA